MYQNPYGSDPQETDPAAIRRKAILDLLNKEPSRTTQATPYTPPPAATYPGAQTAGQPGSSPRDTASGSDMPDLPDAHPANPYAGVAPAPAASGPAGDNGLQYGSRILDLFADPYQRRGGGTGGIGSGALTGASIGSVGGPIGAGVGAVVGGIVGAAKKHALSAPTDFTVQDATEIIKDAYREMNGHEISPEELQSALIGQGWHAGDRYVGQQGLMGVLGHLGENAASTRQAAGAAPASATGGATPSGADASAGAAPAVAGGGGGGVPGNVEGVDRDKWNDPNKHDLKYDALHMIVNAGSIDAAWPDLQKKYPNAKRISGDVIDFGDGTGPVDLQRDSENNGGFHWEPVNDASASADTSTATPAASATGLMTPPGSTQLAAPLTNNDVFQQILAEIARIQNGQPPRAEILQQLGVA
jgi:hypothetical protein